MKTTLLLIAFIFAINAECQVDTSYTVYYPANTADTYMGGEYIPYLIGSPEFPEYGAMETRQCTAEESMTLSNGRRIAGLSCIIFDKELYIGGNLVFENDTTTITDISVIEVGQGAEFKVTGKDFSMSFTLVTGLILRYENNYATFNTEGEGVWTIHKKV